MLPNISHKSIHVNYCCNCRSYRQNQLSHHLWSIFFQPLAPDELMSIIRCNCRSGSQNQCSKVCSCKKHGIQCMSAWGCCHRVGCSNSKVDNFGLDSTDEDIFDVLEDYIEWIYETFINIIPLWTSIFKNKSFYF